MLLLCATCTSLTRIVYPRSGLPRADVKQLKSSSAEFRGLTMVSERGKRVHEPAATVVAAPLIDSVVNVSSFCVLIMLQGKLGVRLSIGRMCTCAHLDLLVSVHTLPRMPHSSLKKVLILSKERRGKQKQIGVQTEDSEDSESSPYLGHLLRISVFHLGSLLRGSVLQRSICLGHE